jgi:hypothetical protein
MSAHTPGPWFAWWNDYYWDINIDDQKFGHPLASTWTTQLFAGAAEANARLIAAAPKLLMAAKTMIEAAQIADEMLDALGREHEEIKIAIRLAQKFVAEAEGRS